ncbi:hypothetical protein [Streptosporangium longisporum]|uniref:hypothetical protein n=1 Tax=Streptosporangium longisporum TaxID=46187 RepID=UPI0031EF475E
MELQGVAVAGEQHPTALVGDHVPACVTNRHPELEALAGELAQHLAELLVVGEPGSADHSCEGVLAVRATRVVMRLVCDLERDQPLSRGEAGRKSVGKPAP